MITIPFTENNTMRRGLVNVCPGFVVNEGGSLPVG